MLFHPANADDYPTFRLSTTDSPELLTLMGLTAADTKINYDSAALRRSLSLGLRAGHSHALFIQQAAAQAARAATGRPISPNPSTRNSARLFRRPSCSCASASSSISG